jgi:hypothetical protein
MMDKLSLALDPRLGLDPDDLVAAWNADAELRGKAEADRGRAAPGTFDPVLTAALVSLAVSVAGSVTSGLVLDFLRARLKAKGEGRDTPLEIVERELPSGERVLVARAKPADGDDRGPRGPRPAERRRAARRRLRAPRDRRPRPSTRSARPSSTGTSSSTSISRSPTRCGPGRLARASPPTARHCSASCSRTTRRERAYDAVKERAYPDRLAFAVDRLARLPGPALGGAQGPRAAAALRARQCQSSAAASPRRPRWKPRGDHPTLNLLVVTARPGGAGDVGYRTITRPLLEALGRARLRVDVDLVRPGTWKALTGRLEAATRDRGAGYYHAVHFDLHGALLGFEGVRGRGIRCSSDRRADVPRPVGAWRDPALRGG